MNLRHECPICRVETRKGVTCGYHRRDLQRHAAEAARHFLIRHWVQVLADGVDDAREARWCS